MKKREGAIDQMKIPVAKYHGCGNDFIIVRRQHLPMQTPSSLVRSLCDRHRGIGADGCIVVGEQPLRMEFYNQDGSRAPMCGNGIRCFAAYCQDQGIRSEQTYDVVTDVGNRRIEVLGEHPFKARVDMGTPVWENDRIGVKETMWGEKLTVKSGEAFIVYPLFMTTIHTVIFVCEPRSDFAMIGAQICRHPLYAKGTNVDFVQVCGKRGLRLWTYERGVGMTLACGSGACAAFVCAQRLRKVEKQVSVQMEGGALTIAVNAQGKVWMSGEAIRIMEGTFLWEEERMEQDAVDNGGEDAGERNGCIDKET